MANPFSDDVFAESRDDDAPLRYEDVEGAGRWVAVRSTDNTDTITYEYRYTNPFSNVPAFAYFKR